MTCEAVPKEMPRAGRGQFYCQSAKYDHLILINLGISHSGNPASRSILFHTAGTDKFNISEAAKKFEQLFASK